jgi:hypothetical protein
MGEESAMATGSVRNGQPNGSGQFLIGLGLGLALVLLLALVTLFELGRLPVGAPDDVGAPAVQAAPEARPTAVWRFRSEWLTPSPR